MSGEAAFLWGVSAALCAALWLPGFLAFRARGRRALARKLEAARLGIDRAPAQHPQVDAGRCIGCGACVDACPEGDVLAVVGGTAAIVNGLRCVGHAHCAQACPVGAIEVGLGDLAARPDIPILDDWHETSVPGLYVAGELGGLALVKNAVAQGRRVVESIARKAPPLRTLGGPDVLDVAIVGAGPAGLAAAAAASERGLRHVVLEQERSLGGTLFHYPRRKMVLVQAMELPLAGRVRAGEYGKEDVLAIFEALARRARLDLRFGERVGEIRREGRLFVVKSTARAYAARALVLALGRRGTPRKLGVPGEDLAKVMYQLVDAESYRGQRVLVVGGGDSAVEAALGLARQPGNRVTLSYRRERLVRIRRQNEERIGSAIREGLVRARFASQVVEILPRAVRLEVAGRVVELENDYVFVFAGGEAPFGLLRQLGVRFGGPSAAAPALAGA
jgi:thioredoxin reductase